MTEQDKVRKALRDLGPGYELVREIGRGATAVVYLVRDHELDRDLAVKVIRSTFTHDEEAVARLQREARLVAKLQHPNIVRVFSTQHLPDGSLALLMEHVPGRDLKAVLRGTGPLEPERVVAILRDVASALAYAHRRRIVHRDVKPENIYVDDEVGTARLADFGIARPWDRDARLTVPGEALGTPAYMSPEQIDGDDVDARTDVYSLGLVGYEMLTGEHPWEDDNLFNIIYKQKNEDLPPLRSARPDVSPALARVVEGALEKDRTRRWASAAVFLDHLNALQPPGARGPGAAPDADLPQPYEGPRAGRPAHVAETEAATVTAAEPGEITTVESDRGRWRKGRVALAAAAVALMSLGTWAWAAWSGEGEGWVSLDEAEPGASLRAEGAAGSGAPAPGAEPSGPTPEAILHVVDEEVPDGGPVGATIPLVLRAPAGDTTARIRFRVIAGGGVLDRASAEPGADGTVRAGLRLPDRPGITTVAASVEGREAEEVLLDVLATPGPPQRVQAIWGEDQVGEPGSALSEALGVRVLDARGNPVSDAEVRFQVLVGDGSLAPERVRTDSVGRAFALWTLGARAGDQRAAALVPSAEQATVVFEATARGAAPGTDPAAPPGDPSRGDPLPPPTPDSATAAPATGAGGEADVVRRPLTVGGTHVCSVGPRGFADCRGALDPDVAGDAVRVRFVALVSGVRHLCGLAATGAAFCWGANGAGQVGDGTRVDRERPTPVQTPEAFSRLALGLDHSCGLDGAGGVHCWGGNTNGQLGDGSRNDRPVPRPVAGVEGMTAVVAGWNHTCALDADGRARCWGLNSEGQLGDGSRLDRVSPTPVSGGVTFSALAAGSAHTCGLGGGIVHCWGADGSGQLGLGGTGGRVEPVRLESLPWTVVDLVAGAVHTCVLLRSGEAWCWGQNVHGQLGDGTTTDRRLPVAVEGGLEFRALEAGGGSTCGISGDGVRYCWGLNQGGQLGDGTRVNRATPTRVGR